MQNTEFEWLLKEEVNTIIKQIYNIIIVRNLSLVYIQF